MTRRAVRAASAGGYRAPGRDDRSTRAFTLLELIVVLALIVILTGVIVPRMGRSVGHRELSEAAGRFAHTARTVRVLAVAQGRTCALEIDLDRGVYGVVIQPGERPAAAPAATFSDRPGQWQAVQMSWLKAQRWPKTVSVDSYRTPDGATAAGGTQYLKFFPDGTSSGVALRLTCRDDAYRVIVHPHSGRVVYGDPSTTAFGQDRYDLGD